MFGIGSEKKRIGELKAQIDSHRDQFGENLHRLSPSVVVAEQSVRAAAILRTAMPVLKPAVMAIVNKGISSRSTKKLIGIGLVVGLGYGAWKWYNSSQKEPQERLT